MNKVPVVLISGDDDVLISRSLNEYVEKALGDEDKSLALEELTEENYRSSEQFHISKLVDSAQTAPFLTQSRVVVGRHMGRFSKKDDLEPLVEYLNSPLETTSLILVWEKGNNPQQQRLSPVPKSLLEAIENSGGILEKLTTGKGKQAEKWLAEALEKAPVELNREARKHITGHFGEDRTKVFALLEVLASVYESGETLELKDVEPYLGDAGSVMPWDLTDSIDSGKITEALERLKRMLRADDRHPLGVLALLHSHYEKMLRLEGSGLKDEKAVANVLSINAYPAKKILSTSQRLGKKNIFRAIGLIAEADLDLKGKKGWPTELVVEVLVARLAAMR
jgi:DNA polymerase-3 subunit delta